MSAQAFHYKCDNQGPTLVVIKSDKNQVFGGYSAVMWNSSNSYQRDDQMRNFIFQLNHKTIHRHFENPQYSIYCHAHYGPTFGDGHAIYISATGDGQCYCRLGIGYEAPAGYVTDQQSTRDYLAGTFRFAVEELEVYKVVVC